MKRGEFVKGEVVKGKRFVYNTDKSLNSGVRTWKRQQLFEEYIKEDIGRAGVLPASRCTRAFRPSERYLHIGHCKAQCIDSAPREVRAASAPAHGRHNPVRRTTDYVDAIQ
jgi:hypothetical protein